MLEHRFGRLLAGTFVALATLGASGCSSQGHDEKAAVGTVKRVASADSVNAYSDNLFTERARTFPTGTYFATTGLRYIAYVDKSSHFVKITNAPLADPTIVPGAFGGPPPLTSPGPGQSAPPFSDPESLLWSLPQEMTNDEVDSDGAVSITTFKGKLYYAFDGTDRKINIESSSDGVNWSKETVNNATSPYAPALVAYKDRLVVSYTGEGDGNLNIFSSLDGTFQGDANNSLNQKVVLDAISKHAPAVASFNGKLYIAWTGFPGGFLGLGTNPALNVGVIDGFGGNGILGQVTTEASDDGPGLIGFGDKLLLSWVGSGNDNLNYATFTSTQIDGDIAGGTLHATKTTLNDNYVSDHTPTIAYFGPTPGLDALGQVALLWTDSNNSGINFINNLFLNSSTVCVDGTIDSPDTDQDGLLDCWEDQGIDFDGDGKIDLDLAAKGAKKDVPDAFVELDYFDCKVSGGDCPSGDTHNHRPNPASLSLVVSRFATQGIHVVFETDEALPHSATCEFEDPACHPDGSCYSETKARSFGTPQERADSAVLGAKKLAYHYGLWVHTITPALSGQSCICGSDFTVGLGQPPADSFFEAITTMHEFGHNLSLQHGGSEGLNFKPNYMSIMNYSIGLTGALQTDVPGSKAPAIIDYSHVALPTLNEKSLNESLGVQDGPFETVFSCPNAFPQFAPGDAPIDWACDGTPTATHAPVNNDINGDRFCVAPATCLLAQNLTCNGPLVTKKTTGNDIFVRGEIDPPKGGSLTTVPDMRDGATINSNGDFAIIPSPSGVFFSMANLAAPDVANGVLIADGPDRKCETTATGADIQVRSVNSTEQDTLTGFDDWSNLHLDHSLRNDRKACNMALAGELGEKDGDIALEAIHEHLKAPGTTDLGVTGSGSFGMGPNGSTITLTYTATNSGTVPAVSPAINVTLPTGVSATSCNGAPCHTIGAIVVVPIAGLTPGQSRTVTIALTVGCSVTTGTTLTFAGKLVDPSNDPNPANNATATSVVVPPRYQDFTLFGSNGVQVNDGATVKTSTATPALIGNSSTSIAINIGNLTTVGTLESVAPIFLGSGNHVTGSITSDGAVTFGLGNTVTGPVLKNQAIALPGLSLALTFPPSQGDVTIGVGATRTLAPGSYGKVIIQGFSHATLTAGTYFFDSLEVDAAATVTLDKTGGPITVDVRTSMTLLSPFQETGGVAGANFLLQYLSVLPQVLTLSVPFSGTLVMPNTGLVLGPIIGGGHKGVFIAKNITVSPATVVTRRPFDPTCN
ncbi:MAG TPA: hypothetical protein VH062_03055 [Polyangiaceae bacterium]|jgi:hypothetical protein|nr:hypothetical protein [Polyangiaceae bacterium]